MDCPLPFAHPQVPDAGYQLLTQPCLRQDHLEKGGAGHWPEGWRLGDPLPAALFVHTGHHHLFGTARPWGIPSEQRSVPVPCLSVNKCEFVTQEWGSLWRWELAEGARRARLCPTGSELGFGAGGRQSSATRDAQGWEKTDYHLPGRLRGAPGPPGILHIHPVSKHSPGPGLRALKMLKMKLLSPTKRNWKSLFEIFIY